MKTIGLARLGRDVDVRQTQGGETVANLAIAFNYGMKDANGNRPTQWIECSLWGKRAETLAPFLLKGTLHCFTLDEIHVETYQKNDGGQGIKLAARCIDVELGPRQDGSAPAGQSAPARQAPASRQPSAGYQSAPQGQKRPAPGFDDMDDSIPF